MINYKDSMVWKRVLNNGDECREEREYIKAEFEKFHKNAEYISHEIGRALPNYTVHDITHIDALWEMVDIILPNDYEITPTEVFVLGGSILLHDLGMALVAYTNQMDEMRKMPIWVDTAVAASRKIGKLYNNKDTLSFAPEVVEIANEKTLRVMHAKKAKELANTSWKDSEGKELFLINDDILRNAYGNVIGLIAESHWWNVSKLKENLPPVLGALSMFKSSWIVDPLKIACILRIADAMQIDDRRAPIFLKALRKPSGYSKLHWIFQEKMYKPRIENSRLIYTSKSPFHIDEVDSWWICYDTLKMIDDELNKVDLLLSEENKKSFLAIGVQGIESTKGLSRLITVEGWIPIDTKIRVNNVSRLVNTIGGSQLYGSSALVPLREMIQNANDAIRARRIIDNEAEDFGEVCISLEEDKSGKYIKVEDNGVGMSQEVLTETLLDFGQSFWSTERMHEEFPKLESLEFKSIGQYGIGFFSVFMWGEKVEVITNKYNQARENSLVLEFQGGTESRPILRKANSDEQLKNGGTIIKVWITDEVEEKILEQYGEKKRLSEMVMNMCVAVDCTVSVMENNRKKIVIKANDWITIKPDKLIERIIGKKNWIEYKRANSYEYMNIVNNMMLIKESNGSIVGRVSLCNRYASIKNKINGTVSVGGFATTELTGIVGILIGNTDRASRDIGIPIVSKKALSEWTIAQVKLLLEEKYSEENQIEIASIVHALTNDITEIKIARYKNTYVNYYEIVEIVKSQTAKVYYIVQDAAIFNYERDKKDNIDLHDNVFVCDMGDAIILQLNNIYNLLEWPEEVKSNIKRGSNIFGKVFMAICYAWGKSLKEIEKTTIFSTDEVDNVREIGTCKGFAVDMDVDEIRLGR